MPDSNRSHAIEVDWPTARQRARDLAPRELGRELLPLADCLGRVVAEPLRSLVDLPSFDTAAMDGWAVVGPGPWRVVDDVRAGDAPRVLQPREAVRIATGAAAPPGSAVVRSERGSETSGHVHADVDPEAGLDIRQRGEEVGAGEQVVPAGIRLTPPALGLLAATGHDQVWVRPKPRIAVLVLGDELLDHGVPEAGRVRDALSPQLPGWLSSMGADLVELRRVTDTLDATVDAVAESSADVILTTGGTARGPADHVRGMVESLGGHWVVDGVRVRPGHPMKLAQLGDGRALVALPGNPLAAVSGLLTLAWPLLTALSGAAAPDEPQRPLARPVDPSPGAHRLVPARVVDGVAHPALRRGPAMLSGMSEADAVVLIEPNAPQPRGPVTVLPLPWVTPL